MDKLDEGRSRLIKSGGFFDEEFIIRLYMEMLVFMSCFGKTGGFRTLLLERRGCLATTRLMSLHVGKGQTAGDAIKRALGYIKDPMKTENGILVTSYGCTPQTVEAEFMLMRREYLTITGRRRGKDDVLAYHLRQSFKPGEITPEEANRIGCELAKRFTHGQHAYVVATHEDRRHVHSHIIISAVNLDCDRKFRNFWGSSKAIRRLSDTLCIQNGLSIIEQPKGHSKSYNKWLGNEAKTSQRDGLREALDAVLARQPKDFEELLTMLQRGGWEVKRGKRISLKGKGQERFKRLDSLGEDYSEAALRAIIAGEKEHHPREKKTVQPMRQVNLLVDIQAKLQAGKGAGYERWAKVFNLKQMAQTLNYLSENNLMNIEDLTAKTDAATARVHELQVTIRETEKRMAELHTLKGHIINYVKTREVYAAYRMAGYSKKFVAEHEQEIKLHQAAKEAFSALGTQKIPKVKAIQAEYDALREKKKQAYAAYHQAQDEMRQLLTVRANVERILGIEEKEKEQQKEKKKER